MLISLGNPGPGRRSDRHYLAIARKNISAHCTKVRPGRPFVVEDDRHHDYRAARDRGRANHRPYLKEGDDTRPPIILCLVREAPPCHTHSEPPFGPQQQMVCLTTRRARILAACKYLVVMLKNAFKPCI